MPLDLALSHPASWEKTWGVPRRMYFCTSPGLSRASPSSLNSGAPKCLIPHHCLPQGPLPHPQFQGPALSLCFSSNSGPVRDVREQDFKTSTHTATGQQGPPGLGTPSRRSELPAPWRGPLRAEFASLACVPRRDSKAVLHRRHTHVHATHTWITPATAPAVMMTQPWTHPDTVSALESLTPTCVLLSCLDVATPRVSSLTGSLPAVLEDSWPKLVPEGQQAGHQPGPWDPASAP